MSIALQQQCADVIPVAPEVHAPGHLFVSTSLAKWTTATPEQFARDVQINDTVYRRLDPEYYAWLRSRMAIVKEAASTGHLPPAAFEDLRLRFNAVHEWAVRRLGEAALQDAVRTCSVRYYRPPAVQPLAAASPRATPRKGGRPFRHAVSASANATVDAIRDRALAAGWTQENLYNTEGQLKFPYGNEYGLVCFLRPQDRIGEVTKDFIELVDGLPTEARRRFFNPSAEHPRVLPVEREKKARNS